MSLQRQTYTDEAGRIKVVLLPEDSKEDPSAGVPVGPPTLESLNLPIEIEVRLNNELYHRNLISAQDALKNRNAILGAIQAALRIDAEVVLAAYLGTSFQNAKVEKQEVRSAEPRANVNRSRRNQRRPVRA